jgi:hypothetical protein
MKEINIVNKDITLTLIASLENLLYNSIFIMKNSALRKLSNSVNGKSMNPIDFKYEMEYDFQQ